MNIIIYMPICDAIKLTKIVLLHFNCSKCSEDKLLERNKKEETKSQLQRDYS